MDNQDLSRQVDLQKLYLRNMQIIKWRLKAVLDIRTGKTKTTYKMTNIEFCVLQIRKILELIALSALISDRDIYETHLKKIGSMWNARLILSDIERIHPNFYPDPILIDPNDKFKWIDITEDFLTKEKFIRIYERCGKFLHENPLKMTNNDIDNEYSLVWKEIGVWGQLISNLLNTHIIRLYNQKDLFYIAMNAEEQPPCGNIFTQIADSDN